MSQKTRKWFKSVFADDSLNEAPTPSKKPRQNDTIDLTQDDGDDCSITTPSTRRPNESKVKPHTLKSINPTSSNWIERFEPRTVTDLAVHPKKIAEIQDWLRHYEATKKKYPGQMLLITGPAGSGKTATVRVVAKEMKYELVEWITPVDVDLVRSAPSLAYNEDNMYRESQVDIFKQFLFKSSRYSSLFDSVQRRLILVEDFPNVFVRDSGGFEDILQNYRDFGKSPLIFIVTDSKSKQLNLAYNLFPDNIRGQYQIPNISVVLSADRIDGLLFVNDPSADGTENAAPGCFAPGKLIHANVTGVTFTDDSTRCNEVCCYDRRTKYSAN
ncbi:unnamed protein product [Hermetia illucens]|uniref:AAA+ ATPase domain-containing protein n=1 Tax=Hermetia illucens TaxID=343691 RepID=A0A7R8V282_HERIL|nr:unnamed protein product [Hermetia illucens]